MEDNSKIESTPADQAKTNAILAWVFAPFTSYAWKDDSNELVKSHARESFYIGVAELAVFVVFTILQSIINSIFFSTFNYGLFGIGAIISLFFSIAWLGVTAFLVVPRILGIVAANNGKEYRLPVVSNLVKKYIKL